jgi:hypothetical protein
MMSFFYDQFELWRMGERLRILHCNDGFEPSVVGCGVKREGFGVYARAIHSDDDEGT